MISKLLYRLTDNLPCRVIHIEGEPYMERYALGKALGLTFYLHRFVAQDGERNVHDHPWAHSLSWVIAGGYIEERMKWLCSQDGWVSEHKHRKRFRFNHIKGGTFHKIISALLETWTLFIHTKRVKGWGFLERNTIEADEPRLCVLYQQPFKPVQYKGWEKQAPIGALHPDRSPFAAAIQ